MSRLIDADELERSVMSLGEDVVCDDCAYEFVNLIDAQPTIEAEPVVHGKWITKLIGERPYCSKCYKTHDCFEWTPRYCPNCGAKMDEVTT